MHPLDAHALEQHAALGDERAGHRHGESVGIEAELPGQGHRARERERHRHPLDALDREPRLARRLELAVDERQAGFGRGVAVGGLLGVRHSVVLRELGDPRESVEVGVGVGAHDARRMAAPDALEHRALQHAGLARVRARCQGRHPLGLEDHDAQAAPLEQERRREARDAGADDGHVEPIAG